MSPMTFPQEPFSLRDLREYGLTRKHLRTALVRGEVIALQRNLYVMVDSEPAPLAIARCLASTFIEPPIFAHTTAALLHGMPTPYMAQQADARLWVLAQPGERSSYRGDFVRVLPAKFEESHVTTVDGLRVTTLARTAMDLARSEPLERGIAVIDHALAVGVPRAELVAIAVFMKGWSGTRVFEPLLAYGDPRSESGLESMSRVLIVEHGLPMPDLQVELLGRSGRRFRADMFWPEFGVIGEVDGLGKYTDSSVLHAEKQRFDELTGAGHVIVRWGYEHLQSPARPALTWIGEALRRRGWKPSAAFLAHLDSLRLVC